MKKLFTLCVLCSVLASCGFSPMYSKELTTETEQIYIETISGTNGIDLRNALKARLGTDNSAVPKYVLKINMNKPDTIYKAIQITGVASWQEVRLRANYTLTDAETGEKLVTAADTASESYNFVPDMVASQASYNNAVQNAIRILADRIEMRVNTKLNNYKSGTSN